MGGVGTLRTGQIPPTADLFDIQRVHFTLVDVYGGILLYDPIFASVASAFIATSMPRSFASITRG